MIDKALQTNIEGWVEFLRSDIPTDRLEGITELASLVVRNRTRGAVRTRGTISRPAPSRLPEGMPLFAVLEAFKDEHSEVRRAVAFTLGEWANENAVKALEQIARSDPESTVRSEAIDALGKIGGYQAVEAIRQAVRADPSQEVKLRAIRALAVLAGTELPASQVVIETLESIIREDSSSAIKDQATKALLGLKQKRDAHEV